LILIIKQRIIYLDESGMADTVHSILVIKHFKKCLLGLGALCVPM
jgi:hypothetical protein